MSSENKGTQVRIGMVNYINTAPIYEVWKQTVKDPSYRIIEEPPSVLNKMLASAQIDLGFVSSYEYCARPHEYMILRDLSISATGPVGSVFLFSHKPLEELDNKMILLSNQSETSVCLVKIILEEFLSLQPAYIVGEVTGFLKESCQAVLAIGDDALRLVSQGSYAYHFDLGEMWYTHTGLPFVFSVCAIRHDFCLANPEKAVEVQQTLVHCRLQGQHRISEICGLAAPRIPMEFNSCLQYLQALQYDLGVEKRQALDTFFNYLIQRGEGSSRSLPLRFFPE